MCPRFENGALDIRMSSARRMSRANRSAMVTSYGRRTAFGCQAIGPCRLCSTGSALIRPAKALTQDHKAPAEYGPTNGRLVIVGGGDDRGTGIMENFVNLAGGPGARFVIVPTAD